MAWNMVGKGTDPLRTVEGLTGTVGILLFLCNSQFTDVQAHSSLNIRHRSSFSASNPPSSEEHMGPEGEEGGVIRIYLYVFYRVF